MTASALLVHLHHQHLVGGNGELVKDKDSTLILLSGDSRGIVVGTQRKYHLLLDSRALEYLLVHNLERHEIHLIRHIRRVLHLGVEIEQPVMGIEPAQQVLDAERLAPDMLDVASVILVDGLGNKVYSLGDSLPSSFR